MTTPPRHITTFLLPCLLFLAAGGLSLAFIEQGDALRFCSDNRSVLGDYFFYYGTMLGEEMTYAILTIIGLFVSYRVAIMIPLTGFVVMGLSNLLKWFFKQKRPALYFGEQGRMEEFQLVDGVYLLEGYTSFPSGHTMSGFALFALVAIIFGAKKWWISPLCLLAALTVGLSRVYLFQHFLRDVVAGAVIGVALAYLIHYLFSFRKHDRQFWMNGNILDFMKLKRLW